MPVPRSRSALLYDVSLSVVAVVIVVVAFVRWAARDEPLHGITWAALALDLALVLLLLIEEERWTMRNVPAAIFGITLAVLASDRVAQDPYDLLPMWGVAVIVGYYVVRMRRFLAPGRAAAVIIAGLVLCIVEDLLSGRVADDWQLLAGMVTFAAVDLALLWPLRRFYGHVAGIPTGYPPADVLAFLVTLAAGFVALSLAEHLGSHSRNLLVVAMLAVMVWQAARIHALTSITQAIIEGAHSTPWSGDGIDDILLDLVRRHLPAESVTIEAAPGMPGDITEQVDEGRYLVVRRQEGDDRFSANERRLAGALAAMGRTSYLRAHRETQLRAEVVMDELTGLWQYAHWRGEMLAEQSATREPGELIGVVFFDLDRFHNVNETYGHVRGDIVLATVGDRLRNLSHHWRFARFGGDEFVGLVREVRDEQHLAELCDDLARLVAEPITAEGKEIVQTVTVGRVLSRDPADPVARLVARADGDLRRRKAARATREQGPTDQEMVQALFDDGLTVVMQPVLLLATGVVDGWESLLRGRVGEHGMIPPDELVEAARRLGALDSLTRRVAEVALDTAEEASRLAGRRMGVSVNLETEQLRWDSELIDWLCTRAESTSARLIIEITERGDGTWTEEQYEVVEELNRHGAESSLDDWGSGQSRLRAVARRSWHWVKLDRDYLVTEERGLVMLRHNVEALHELGLLVVQEGLENAGQVALAKQLGIEYGQGIYLGRPLRPDELLAGLDTHVRDGAG